MLNFAAEYRPAATKPRTAEPMTAPAKLIVMKVNSTMIANAILVRFSLVFASLTDWVGCFFVVLTAVSG